MKRVIIAEGVFRISIPGVDVDAADEHEFVLHEDHLCAQPFFMQWVACPISGTSSSLRTSIVSVTVPPMTDNTVMISYTDVANDAGAYYPTPPAAGGNQPTGATSYFGSAVGTTLQVVFLVPANVPAPNGAYVILLRGEII